MSIGLDDALHDVYESLGMVWRAVLPAPVIADATFLDKSVALPGQSLIFREDSFDATTRVRRGRLYVSKGRDGVSTMPHPIYGSFGSMSGGGAQGGYLRMLNLFDQYQTWGISPLGKMLSIGAPESAWQVLAAERISTGEYLLTLKTRRAFGILPELNAESVPDIGRQDVIEAVSKLTDAAYRESAVSIVDRARDAVQSCLGTWAASKWSDNTLLHKDVGPLIKDIRGKVGSRKHTFIDAAEIVRILHVRGKGNERRKLGLRSVLEDDAELALKAVGFLLHEFEWV